MTCVNLRGKDNTFRSENNLKCENIHFLTILNIYIWHLAVITSDMA